MFSSIAGKDRGSNLTLAISVAVHCLLLFLILLPPRAIFISPSSVKAGVNGKGLTYIYFPTRAGKTHDDQSAATRRLILQREAKVSRHRMKLSPLPEAENKKESASTAAPAGSVYGSSTIGSPIGQ